MKKMYFVYNPRAGKSQIKTKLADILDIFQKADYEITIHPTQAQGEAVERVRGLSDEYDMVACCGGDGTLDEVVTGMMEREIKCPIGYIPAGSTNDFATSLKIPKNMLKAAECIVNGKNYACDIGQINGDSFVYIAAFGLFTDVSYETPQDVKNVLGHMAYLLEGMRRLPQVRSFHYKVSYEDQVIEDDFLFGMITNSMSVGGFKSITGKKIKLDDGVFEVTLIKRPANPIEFNETMAALIDRDINASGIYSFKTNHIILESEEEVPWTTDGEYGGHHTKIEIFNKKQALQLRVPQ